MKRLSMIQDGRKKALKYNELKEVQRFGAAVIIALC
jgi:hypothetical protein